MSDERPRLYLISPVIRDAAGFAPLLEAAMEAADIACILLRFETRDKGDAKKIIKLLAPKAQSRGAACLIETDPQLAVQAGADGVHITGTGQPLRDALAALQPGRIAGAGGLFSRDAAMEAGEAGVDYLMFGGPGQAETREGIVERVSWWAEIFNVPCIGYAHDLAAVANLVKAKADFVCLSDCIWEDPRGPGPALAGAEAALNRQWETAA